MNSNRDQDVRRALTPLKRMAERTGAAVVLVRHLNKTPGGNPLYRGGGSIGIIGAARSGMVVGKHPDDEELRVLAGQKNNLSLSPESLAYGIETAERRRPDRLQGRLGGYRRPAAKGSGGRGGEVGPHRGQGVLVVGAPAASHVRQTRQEERGRGRHSLSDA